MKTFVRIKLLYAKQYEMVVRFCTMTLLHHSHKHTLNVYKNANSNINCLYGWQSRSEYNQPEYIVTNLFFPKKFNVLLYEEKPRIIA